MRGTYKRGGGADLDLWREFTVMPGNREDNTQANLKSYLLEEWKVEKSYVTLGKACTGNDIVQPFHKRQQQFDTLI